MSHYVGKNVDYTQPARNTGESTFLATDGYGRLVTIGSGGTGAGGDITSAQLHSDLLMIDADMKNGTSKMQIVDSLNNSLTLSASSDGYAAEVIEQFAPVYEDNLNGVAAVTIKPIANSSYALSFIATTALATNIVIKGSPGKLYRISGFLNQTDGYATQHYVQLHNAISLPANTAVPFWSMPLNTRATAGPVAFEFEFVDGLGLYMNTGIVAAISTTSATLTIATVYNAWFNAHFI